MKAVVRDEYGSPEVLRLEEVPRPIPRDDELLIRVHAASVNKGDTEILRGDPLWVRMVGFGLIKPKIRILGTNLAGRIEVVGARVTRFKPGDEVFGDILQCGLGAFAEYVCIPESATIVRKPPRLSFQEAASLPEAGFIALQGLRDKGQLKPGQRVLINGAGGGAGSFAIQLAKAHGAEVTGVDSTEKQGWMRSLGADHVVDYTREDFSRRETRYEVILDVVGARSVFTWKRALASGGIYAAAGGSVAQITQTLLLGAMVSWASSKSLGMLAVQPNRDDLHAMVELIGTGKVKPTIERRYPLEETADAIRYVGAGRAKGRVVVTI